MLLVACGDIDHERTRRLVAERFAALPSGPERRPDPVDEPPLTEVRTAHLHKDVHQAHLLMGVRTVSVAHADRSALKVIERVLGMGASARLYQRLREQARLVYNVSTVAAHYEDAGYLAAHAACDPDNVAQVRETILAEWRDLRRSGASADELEAAKGNYAGNLARRFETNLSVAGIFGIEGLLGQVETFRDAVARINAVERDDVIRAARQYLDPDRHVAVTLGRQPGVSRPVLA
jgi:predicted Zn-dependent peptidase